MDAVLAKKIYFTLLLPHVAHLVAVKTVRQILSKCFQASLEVEVLIGYLIALMTIPVVYFTAQACDQCWIELK